MTARIGKNVSVSAGVGVGLNTGEVGARGGFSDRVVTALAASAATGHKGAMTRFLVTGATALAVMMSAAPADAQQQQPAVAPSALAVPSELELAKMIWSTMAAVDHANVSGNYSVLRDLSAPGFQIANDPARLTQIFSSLRAGNVDLSNALLLAPTYRARPRMVQADILQVQGSFGLRPTAIAFELLYQYVQGRWRLFGVSIGPMRIATEQPGGAPPQQQQPAPPRKR